MNLEKIKAKYLIGFLPDNIRRKILFSLSLDEEKKLSKKINVNTKKEMELLISINNSIQNRIINKKRKSSFFKVLIFTVFYIILITAFFAIIFFNTENGLSSVIKFVNSGIGHFFIFIYIIFILRYRQAVNITKELLIKKISALEIFMLIFCVIIISLSLYFVNLLASDVPFENPNDYFVISLFFYTTFVPLTEELIFRRYIYRGLRLHLDKFTAVVLTSILFAMVHNFLNLYVVIATFVSSLLLCILYELKGNLIIPLIAHSLSNLVILGFRYFFR